MASPATMPAVGYLFEAGEKVGRAVSGACEQMMARALRDELDS
ncbi:MAG: hypothetical protein ACR2NG_07825 [Acidimicrobiia bacterium]